MARRRPALPDAAALMPGAKSRWLRRQLAPLALLLALVAALGGLGHSLGNGLAARGLQFSFEFLGHAAGFDLGYGLLPFTSGDSYARALLVGLLNTLQVAAVSLLLATAIGGLVGVGQGAADPWLARPCRVYVETFRNTPLLLQLLLWYGVLTELLPGVREAWQIAPGIYLCQRGLYLPVWSAATGWSLPQPGGFDFEGGVALRPELLALVWGLASYTAAYIAEVVRAGLAAVPRAQRQAGLALGLTAAQTLRAVVLPQALRVILPPLGSQYLNLVKNSSLAVAIGYPDLLAVADTTLNQTGRALEVMLLVLLTYLVLSLAIAALVSGYEHARRWREGG